MSHLAAVPDPLTPARARRLTDDAKQQASNLWRLLLSLYEGQAHIALGYDSWAEYAHVEFGASKAYAHQLVDAGRVALAAESAMADRTVIPSSERVARELAPLLRTEGDKAVAEAWGDAIAEHGPEPTAKQVRETVQRRMGKKSKLTKEQQAFGNVLRSMELSAEYVAEALDKDPASLLDVDAATRTKWAQQTRVIYNASGRLWRRFLQK